MLPVCNSTEIITDNINLLQTIETVPIGIMDIAKANSTKNRYLNIHTCKWQLAHTVATTDWHFLDVYEKDHQLFIDQ